MHCARPPPRSDIGDSSTGYRLELMHVLHPEVVPDVMAIVHQDIKE